MIFDHLTMGSGAPSTLLSGRRFLHLCCVLMLIMFTFVPAQILITDMLLRLANLTTVALCDIVPLATRPHLGCPCTTTALRFSVLQLLISRDVWTLGIVSLKLF